MLREAAEQAFGFVGTLGSGLFQPVAGLLGFVDAGLAAQAPQFKLCTAVAAKAIERETNLTAVSHLTCVCHSLAEMEQILDRYTASGVENILALSGDVPKSMPAHDRSRDCFRYAEDLVRSILERTPVPV